MRIVPLEWFRCEPLRFAFKTGVFNHDAHAVMTVIVGQVAHDPNTRMIHLNDGGNAFCGSQPQTRYAHRFGERVAIHRDHTEAVSRQSQTANLGRTAIQNVKQHALPLFHPDRLSVTQHVSVDGERIVADLVAVRHPLGEGSVHLALALVLETGDRRGW